MDLKHSRARALSLFHVCIAIPMYVDALAIDRRSWPGAPSFTSGHAPADIGHVGTRIEQKEETC